MSEISSLRASVEERLESIEQEESVDGKDIED